MIEIAEFIPLGVAIIGGYGGLAIWFRRKSLFSRQTLVSLIR